MIEYLFSYGTLQRDDVQLNLFGRLLTGTKDRLDGHRTARIEITDAAFLSKGEGNVQLTPIESDEPSDRIEGTVFELSAEELAQADKYEPVEYSRTLVTLASGRRAWIYAAGTN